MRCTYGLAILSIFFGGLHWHLSGLSEVPLERLNSAFFYYMPARFWPYFAFYKTSLLSPDVWFNGHSYDKYGDVVVQHFTTKRHGNVETSPAQNRKKITCRPERDNVRKQTELVIPSMSSRITYLDDISGRIEKSEYICLAKTFNRQQNRWKSWCDARRTHFDFQS